MMDTFHTTPIELHHFSSIPADDKTGLSRVDQHCFHNDAHMTDAALDIPQRLEPEQYQYEFPPKSHLKALAHLYDNTASDNTFSFFDETSFPAPSVLSPHTDHVKHTLFGQSRPTSRTLTERRSHHPNRFADSPSVSWYRDNATDDSSSPDSLDGYLVDDDQLSPFQLPAPSQSHLTHGSQSCQQSRKAVATPHQPTKAATPSSFLSFTPSHDSPFDSIHHDTHSEYSFGSHQRTGQDDPPQWQHTRRPVSHQSAHHPMIPTFERASGISMGNSSIESNETTVVLMKLSRSARHHPLIVGIRCATSHTWAESDEGYDDKVEDEKEPPMPSDSTFHQLSAEEQHHLVQSTLLRTAAAVTIQAAWRGYCFRKARAASSLAPAHRLMVDVIRLCGSVHRRQMMHFDQRIRELQHELREETAMRIAFEKAMEDMTILVDQQQKMLYDRLEQEISMRQAYEQKMKDAMDQVKPLAARIQKEAKARCELESMMKRVLGQVHDLRVASQTQSKHDAAARIATQRKLDDARTKVASLKRQTEVPTPPARPPSVPARPPSAPARPPSKTARPPTTRPSSRPRTTPPSTTLHPPNGKLGKPPVSRPRSRQTTLTLQKVGTDVKRPGTAHALTRASLHRAV